MPIQYRKIGNRKKLRFTRRTFILSTAAVALGIASCQPQAQQTPTGATTPAASPVADAGANITLTGAGASFPAPLYQLWFAEYNKKNPNVQINYQSIGSGAGIQQFIKGTVDFAASDVAMTKEEIAKVEQGVILLPMTAGSIVVAYNIPDIKTGLRLPRDVFTDIFLGNIKNWNDARIAKANKDIKLPNLPINVVHRSDGSGTTSVFTEHLSAISPQWKSKVGTGRSVSWPAGSGAKGNKGVTAQIQQNQGTIGYVEYSFAKKNNLAMAALQNKAGNFIMPTPEAATKTLAAVELPENLVAFITDPEGAESYPIVTYTWLLAYDNYKDPKEAETLKSVIEWALTDGQKFSAELGYIPLPEKVVEKAKAAANRIVS
ncbi:Periplasmic phosphate binding protein [Rivularia sp. IAM M-261]|nr:Periplasmic phosphate binding protein [Rivularia sp. IAM M-261]